MYLKTYSINVSSFVLIVEGNIPVFVVFPSTFMLDLLKNSTRNPTVLNPGLGSVIPLPKNVWVGKVIKLFPGNSLVG